jgi:hypothetical protein
MFLPGSRKGPFEASRKLCHLRIRRQLADLVDKNGTTVSELELSLPPLKRTGKRASLVTEQFGRDERRRDGRAVHRDERARRSCRPPVNRPRDELLVCSGFNGDPGHDTRRRPHPCARERPRCEQGGRRRPRHRVDGRLGVRHAVLRRRRQARPHGRVSARRRWLGDDLTVLRSGTSASTGPRRRPLFAVVNGPTSSTSGTISPLTRPDRSPRRIVRPTRGRMPVPAGCARRGRTSCPFSRQPETSRASRKRN